MRNFSGGLATAIAATSSTLGFLLDITKTRLNPVYLNTAGADWTDNSNSPTIVYKGTPGFVMGDLRITDGSDPGTLAIEVPLSDSNNYINRQLFELGAYKDAVVRVRIFDYVSGDISPDLGFRWVVGQCTITDDGKGTMEIVAATRIQRELILHKYRPGCQDDLGGPYCGVDVIGLWTDTVTIATVASAYSFTISGARLAAIDDFYANGAIKFISGDPRGEAFTVRKWTQSTSTVLTWEPVRGTIDIGISAQIHAGCDKTTGAAGCGRFSNWARRIAWDHLPPDDAKFAYEVPVTPDPVVVIAPDPNSWWDGWQAYG